MTNAPSLLDAWNAANDVDKANFIHSVGLATFINAASPPDKAVLADQLAVHAIAEAEAALSTAIAWRDEAAHHLGQARSDYEALRAEAIARGDENEAGDLAVKETAVEILEVVLERATQTVAAAEAELHAARDWEARRAPCLSNILRPSRRPVKSSSAHAVISPVLYSRSWAIERY